MPTKAQFYAALAERHAQQITENSENWTDFLRTAGRLYKYPFEEQLMIHAQRPDAMAVAPIHVWNHPMNRYVQRGSKGIALLDMTDSKPRLKYVFDYADTEDGRYNPRRPFIWQMKPEHEQLVAEALVKIYDIPESTKDIGSMLYDIARDLVSYYYEDNARDIRYAVEGSFLEDYDDYNIEVAFKEAATVSTAYALMTRCGIDPAKYISDEDFQTVYNFNSPTAVYALGNAVSTVTEDVLRDIEVTIKYYEREYFRQDRKSYAERSESYGRDDIQPEQGLSSPEYIADGGNGRTSQQIRTDENDISEGTPPNTVHDADITGEAVPALSGNRDNGDRTAESANDGFTVTNSAAGQINRPDGMDGSYEQSESASGGNNSGRTNLRLENTKPQAETSSENETDGVLIFPVIPTEQEQIDAIRQTEEVFINSQPAVITQDDIDNAIMAWNGDNESKQRVLDYMRENSRARNTVEWLKNEYGGDLQAFTVSKDGAEDVTLSWQKVQRRIGQLMEAGLFVLPDEQTNDDIPLEQRTAEINNQSDIWYRVGDTVYFNNSEFEIINITDNENGVTLRNTSGDLFSYNLETFDALLYTNNRNRELRSERIKSINEIPAGTELLGSNSVWQEYQALERQHIDKIIIYQIGDFYEVMGSDASVVAKTLEINLTNRDVGLPERVPMCGFPDFKLDDYVEKLTDNGFSVAVRHTDGTVILNEVEQPEIPEESGYILTYRYINDRLLVSNEFNYDPDDPDTFLPPNVARVEPDHSIVWLDENLPEVERLEIQRVAETEFDRYKEQAEARGQAMFDFALSVAEEYDLSLEKPPENEQFSLFDLPDEFTPVEPETVDIPDSITTESQRPQISAANFRITDDHLGEGGAKTKYGYNVTAIQILQAIEAENRHATPEEQEILSRYVGWGGLPQAFDPNNKQWEREYAELKVLLSTDEYDMARSSTLNAHYTSPIVIKSMYETLEQLGFKDGNILEPACGIGNFFGLLPDSMQKSKLYGVELDSITGRIAQQLYPNADIKIMGFEKTTMSDAFFDVAIGNVPFGSYKLNDPKYNKNDFLIHDYFFGKALDQVRPGGIIAFITSKGTLDKANPEVRKYIAQRAELLGAVRLPNDAFQKNAGTEVTSDIIFLQKRDRLIDIQPEWIHLGQTENGVPVNSYFVDNPQMMLGTMAFDDRMYGNNSETTLNPTEGADLAEQLKTALSHIHGKITEVELDDLADEMAVRDSVPADPNVRNFSYTMIDNDVYFRENSRMRPVDLPAATLERVKGMVALCDVTHKLIDYQLNDYPDEYIKTAQNNLNRLYDDFTQKHGLINSNANSKAFSSDSAYYLLCSLEILNENNELARKSDMFTKRTIKQKSVVTSVDTSTEALAVSIAQKARVDINLMTELTGFMPEKITSDLQGIIFLNSQTLKYESADEYLSGNVREKLSTARTAAENNPDYIVNVKALEQVQPKDLDASEISVRLGATWVDKEYIQKFMYELLQTPSYYRSDIKVNYSERTAEWNISGKTRVAFNDVLATSTYGTTRANAYKIMEDTLNLRDVRVYDKVTDADGKEQRILNKKETMLACQRQEAIKEKFKDWVFNDPKRRQALVAKYNTLFNSTRPREYDGSHIDFAGISPEIKLKPHQTAAIARILYGGNTLLAHEVGAGKTFEMVGAAMESKRLGLCQKSMMSVPNHLTEQMASEFLRLYPSANLLVATKKDFETKNRKKFCAKIATGDYDCVIIGHSQLESATRSRCA